MVALVAPVLHGAALLLLVLKATLFVAGFIGAYLGVGGKSQLALLFGAAPLPVFLRSRNKGRAS
jgi:hypothetical protein